MKYMLTHSDAKGFCAARVVVCVCVCMLITFYVQSFKRKITNTFKNRAYALMLMMLGFIYETLNLSRWLLFEHHLREGGPCPRPSPHNIIHTHTHSVGKSER